MKGLTVTITHSLKFKQIPALNLDPSILRLRFTISISMCGSRVLGSCHKLTFVLGLGGPPPPFPRVEIGRDHGVVYTVHSQLADNRGMLRGSFRDREWESGRDSGHGGGGCVAICLCMRAGIEGIEP